MSPFCVPGIKIVLKLLTVLKSSGALYSNSVQKNDGWNN